ncbi:MAG: Sigma-70, region 4, partial [Verrucomicrobiota bacterium]
QQELSYQEIAVIMEASESAVKTWIYRARQFLKQELKDLV